MPHSEISPLVTPAEHVGLVLSKKTVLSQKSTALVPGWVVGWVGPRIRVDPPCRIGGCDPPRAGSRGATPHGRGVASEAPTSSSKGTEN